MSSLLFALLLIPTPVLVVPARNQVHFSPQRSLAGASTSTNASTGCGGSPFHLGPNPFQVAQASVASSVGSDGSRGTGSLKMADTSVDSLSQDADPPLRYGREAKTVAESTGNKKIRLMHLFQTMHEGGAFSKLTGLSTHHKHVAIPSYLGEQQLCRNVMEVLFMVLITDTESCSALEEKAQEDDISARLTLHEQLERKVMDKMWELEGLDPVFERKMQAKSSGSGKKPFLVGFGQRVTKLKNEIKKRTGGTLKPKDMPLVPITEVGGEGTPEGHRSIRSFFGAANSAASSENGEPDT